jgi:hypothetical protein
MIIPAGKQTSDYEAGLAVMLYLPTQPNGEADFKKLFLDLRKYIQLTPLDHERSLSRAGDLKWHTAVRNIGREPYPPGNPIRGGYLVKQEKGIGGYRLTSKPWTLPPQQIGLFGPGSVAPPPVQPLPPPPISQSAYLDRFGKLVTRCLICGSNKAPFGIGVSLRNNALGEWFCSTHRPKDVPDGNDTRMGR